MIIKHSETPEFGGRRLATWIANTLSRPSGSLAVVGNLRPAVRAPCTCLGVLALALIPPSIVFAADSDSADLQEIVVTARMRAENLIDVPISTSVFSTKEINDARIQNPIDFVAQSPNVSLVLSQNAGTSFMTIRGISQVRNGESPVAVVVDGVQIVDPAQFTQELVDVQQIEVLRGPQGALYGRDASGGAILITTRPPTNEYEGHVTAGGGNGDEVETEGSLSGPIIPDKLLFRVSGRYVDRVGYYENITLDRKVDPYRDQSYRTMLKWLVDDATTVDLRANFDRVVDGANNFVYQPTVFGPDGRTLAPGSFPFNFSSPAVNANNTSIPFTANYIGYNFRDIDEVSLKFDHRFDFGTLTYLPAFNRIEEFLSTKQFPYTAGLSQDTLLGPVDGTSTQYTLVNAWSQELRFASPSDQKFRWMVGAYYLREKRFISTTTGTDLGLGILPIEQDPAFNSSINPTLSFDGDDNTNKYWAGFANVDYDITSKLEGSVAFRYDAASLTQYVSALQTGGAPGAVNRANFSKPQPKVSLRYSVDSNLSVYASYGVGFRAGQFNQNGTGAAAAAVGLPGVSDLLKAEEVDTAELGLKSEWLDHRIRVEASLYDTTQKNAPYFVFVGAITAQVLVPIDKVDLYGGEFTVTANLAPGLDAFAGYGYTHSEIKTYALAPADVGNRAPYVPNATVDGGLQYRVPITSTLRLFSRIQYQRLGDQYWDPENTTARNPVNLVGGRLGIETMDNHWSLIGTINNALDKRYNSEWVSGGYATLAPPRTWLVEATYHF
jgi:iron complex outermembrane receptor protein